MLPPAVGEVEDSWGAAGRTVTVTLVLPDNPPESSTEAEIICVPLLSTLLALLPTPIAPSMLDVQTRFAERLPS